MPFGDETSSLNLEARLPGCANVTRDLVDGNRHAIDMRPQSEGNHPLRIFVLHASPSLTNHTNGRINGDGLIAWGFIKELARRGFDLYVAAPEIDILGEVPKNVHLVPIAAPSWPFVGQLVYVAKARRLYDKLRRGEAFEIVHQLNPVTRGLSLGFVGIKEPLILGTYVGDWRYDLYSELRIPRDPIRFGKLILDFIQQRFADRLLLATPFAFNRVPGRSSLMGRVEFLQHGIDVDTYNPRREPGDPPPVPDSILFLSRVEKYKGIYTLMDAMPAIVRELPSVTLIVVGAGPEAENLRRFSEGQAWGANVRWVGQVSRETAAGWIRASTVFCQPSYGDPCPTTVLEAMACAKPVVAGRAGGAPYLVPEGGGTSFVPGDASALARALLQILSNPAKAATMGAMNRSVVESRNSWTVIGDRLEAIYRSAIATRSNRLRGKCQ